MGLSKKQIQHLYWRAGFGVDPSDLKQKEGKSIELLVDDLFKKSKNVTPLHVNLKAFEVDQQQLSQKEKKALRKLMNKTVLELDVLWMSQMASTREVLREKLTFFFHDHFAVRMNSPRANLHLNNLLREYALGNFGELLLEVSKSPAMISFLNNQQNKKDHPNENFAREIMELFTLGRDNGYTEIDIHEAARAFTGWRFNKEGQFIQRQRIHDTGSKTFLGETGNFNGEDIIRIILEKRQTARYLTEKLVDFFIGREIPANIMEDFTSTFFDSNYDISALVRAILLSPEFMDETTIGCKIKSPTELLVGMTRLFEIDYKDPKILIHLQRKLNQLLFFPPNVAGWSGGKSWIDSSTLMLRLKLASALLNFGVIEWDEKGDLPEQVVIRIEKQRDSVKKKTEKRVKAYPNWNAFEKKMKNEEADLLAFLIQPKLSAGASETLKISDSESLKDRAIEILSLPEYQLF
ncbi:MAG: hypothetical protein ACI837_001418 [Crocinitomicaceae bacterium]|jgi:uncharacterized protein (DUF1800 family)